MKYCQYTDAMRSLLGRVKRKNAYYPDICSALKHPNVASNFVSGQQMPLSDCANAQAGLDLRCPHMPGDIFSHGEALLMPAILKDILSINRLEKMNKFQLGPEWNRKKKHSWLIRRNYIFDETLYSLHQMRSAMRKRVFRYMRLMKTQISLCIHTAWSGPSLSVNRTTGYYRMYKRIKTKMILCACAWWPEALFAWCGPNRSRSTEN